MNDTLERKETLSPTAIVYREAQKIAFEKLARSQDHLGRSLAWKVDAIKEDLAAHKDSSVVDEFAKEVIRIAEKMMK